MIIRRLGPADAAHWRDIRLEALGDAPDVFDASLSDWQHRPLSDFAARLAQVPTFAAGDAQDHILAVAAWQTGLDPRDAQRGWLLSVYARPLARGRGYASAAIRAVMDDARAAGMTSMGLNVRETAEHAQALYARLGFRATGREGVRNARGLPEIEMIGDL